MRHGCLSERHLLEWVNGEAPPRARGHAEACAQCRARADALRIDLGRITRALQGSVPRASVAPERGPLRWFVPLAAASLVAAGVAALFLGTWLRRPGTADLAEVAALQSELSHAVFGTRETTARATGYESLELAIGGGASTCNLDDPFFGVGCEASELASFGHF